jgi:hypothetical protein
MALKKTSTVKGVVVNDCYIKVHSIQGDKQFMRVTIAFCADKDQQPFDLTEAIFEPSMEGGNFIAQAYNHIKRLPEFAGAVDC